MSRRVAPLSPPRTTCATGLPGEVAHGADQACLVDEERVDGGEVEVDDLFAGRARVGDEGAVGLGAALVAEEDLGPLVADEEGRGGAELRRDAAEHRPLADREEPRARARELEHDGGAVLRLDAAHDLVEALAG